MKTIKNIITYLLNKKDIDAFINTYIKEIKKDA